jgi:hypothetical protein
MTSKILPPRVFLVLAAIALVLVVSIAVVLAFGALLGAMGDEVGSLVLHRVAAGLGIVLLVDLICLVLALAIRAAANGEEPPDEA